MPFNVFPRHAIFPELYGSLPVNAFKAEVFPAPFGPIKQWIPVCLIEKDRPLRIATGPICTETLSNSNVGDSFWSAPGTVSVRENFFCDQTLIWQSRCPDHQHRPANVKQR